MHHIILLFLYILIKFWYQNELNPIELKWARQPKLWVELSQVKLVRLKKGLSRVEFLRIKFRVELSFNLLQLIEPEPLKDTIWPFYLIKIFNQNMIKQFRLIIPLLRGIHWIIPWCGWFTESFRWWNDLLQD